MDAVPLTERWLAVTAAECAALADAGWRMVAAPLLARATEDRAAAVRAARALARGEGAGHLVRLALPGGAAAMVVTAEVEYRGPVADREVERAEAAMGRRLPPRWRAYLQRASWFHRGWLTNGAYVWLYPPADSAAALHAWAQPGHDADGMVIIGGDGAREMLVVDARRPDGAVASTEIASLGWPGAVVQRASIDAFVAAIEDDSFDFVFADDE